jgi:hypothetical protein
LNSAGRVSLACRGKFISGYVGPNSGFWDTRSKTPGQTAVAGIENQADRRLRPLARRARIIARPPRVAMRARKP